jgi:hypothetical protein
MTYRRDALSGASLSSTVIAQRRTGIGAWGRARIPARGGSRMAAQERRRRHRQGWPYLLRRSAKDFKRRVSPFGTGVARPPVATIAQMNNFSLRSLTAKGAVKPSKSKFLSLIGAKRNMLFDPFGTPRKILHLPPVPKGDPLRVLTGAIPRRWKRGASHGSRYVRPHNHRKHPRR